VRLRTSSRADEAFDGLTAEEIRRIRGAGEACVTPGLEGLAEQLEPRTQSQAQAQVDKQPTKNKRGRRQ
jgi:hypothetical protein